MGGLGAGTAPYLLPKSRTVLPVHEVFPIVPFLERQPVAGLWGVTRMPTDPLIVDECVSIAQVLHGGRRGVASREQGPTEGAESRPCRGSGKRQAEGRAAAPHGECVAVRVTVRH